MKWQSAFYILQVACPDAIYAEVMLDSLQLRLGGKTAATTDEFLQISEPVLQIIGTCNRFAMEGSFIYRSL